MNQSPNASDHGPSMRRTALSYLTTVSHGSSPFITTFLLIHLSAPVLANLGGASLSSQVMVSKVATDAFVRSKIMVQQFLGREYYQTSFGEKYLLLAPLILHTSSGVAKRLLSDPPTKSPRPLSSLLTLTGYGMFLFLPIHVAIHRLHPADSSMLDFEFVKLGLHKWPWRSWFLYGSLVGCVVLHAAEGMNIIGRTWAGSIFKTWKSNKRMRRIAAGIGAVPLFTGLCFIFQEPLTIFPSLARQFEMAFTRSWIYRF